MGYPLPFYDKYPDQGFLEHRERPIFPFLRKRFLFTAGTISIFMTFSPPMGKSKKTFLFIPIDPKKNPL
ncbi:hypothetical protein BCY86_00650 [Pajaroellobacter abortibovis]|uniref:Uncharacterized protein n=1 Tax=Pajaroellobacter abortibovis TaxID=1882918 RepID=A0A1L6MV08_9BACT|nr:hypothetical protein BCY86_00650 [Pajaroellobacter abortibovis]